MSDFQALCQCSMYCIITGPHRLITVHRCGLLLQMPHVAYSLYLRVCVCLGVGHNRKLCKMAEPTVSKFGADSWRSLRYHVGGVQIP